MERIKKMGKIKMENGDGKERKGGKRGLQGEGANQSIHLSSSYNRETSWYCPAGGGRKQARRWDLRVRLDPIQKLGAYDF